MTATARRLVQAPAQLELRLVPPSPAPTLPRALRMALASVYAKSKAGLEYRELARVYPALMSGECSSLPRHLRKVARRLGIYAGVLR